MAATFKCSVVVWGAVVLLSLGAQSLPAQTTFSASKDNTLIESSTGAVSNGAGDSFFVGANNDGSLRRALIAFDLSSIPTGSTVTSVTLRLVVNKTMVPARSVALHRVLSNWGEGTSNASGGSGAGSASGDATWIHRFFNSETWNSPGGDFSQPVSASTSVGGTGSYTWGSTANMVADVQGWVNDPANNFGWILTGDEGTRSTKRFDSRQSPIVANRPVLTVSFTPPTSVEDDPGVPARFSLSQNYPNPFNPTTVITYTIPPAANSLRVVLEVFSLLGEKVCTLVNTQQPTGSYKVQWDGKGDAGELLASGVYLYRLRAGDFVSSRKMAFIR